MLGRMWAGAPMRPMLTANGPLQDHDDYVAYMGLWIPFEAPAGRI